jgi:hypothetical protein
MEGRRFEKTCAVPVGVQTCQRNILPPCLGKLNRVQLGADVIRMNECVSEITRVEGILVNQNYGRAKVRKNMCCPSGSSEFQDGVRQFLKTNSLKKNAMIS